MCYSLIVGKKASASGKVILAANDDWPGCPGHILYEESHSYEDKDCFKLVSGELIPQVKTTFSYIHSSAAYSTGWRTESWNEGVNECGVAVSMDGVYAFKSIDTTGGLQADDVPILILERAKTAREGIELIGQLIKKYGFSVSDIEGAAGAVVVAVADENEGFFLELMPGGIWVAKKVEDDEVEVRPNCFGVQEIDFNDEEKYMYSDNIKTVAMEKGWYAGNEKFNFSCVYSDEKAICAYGGPNDDVNCYRRWDGIYRLAKLDTELSVQIYSAKAENVTVSDVKALLGDGMQGTKYDLMKDPRAGLHQNPFFQDISYSVGQAGTVVGMVIDYSFSNSKMEPMAWFAFGNVSIAPFVPCFVSNPAIAPEYAKGEWGEYSEDSAWYVMEELCEHVYKRYDVVMPYIAEKREEWGKLFTQLWDEAKGDTKEITARYSRLILEEVKKTNYYLRGHCIANTFS